MGQPPDTSDLPEFGGSAALSPGLAVRQVLRLRSLAGATVAGGNRGLARTVQRVSLIDAPDRLPAARRSDFLLTTCPPLPDTTGGPAQLIRVLDRCRAAGLAVPADSLAADMRAEADRLDFPLIGVPRAAHFDDILQEVSQAILARRAGDLARIERLHHCLDQAVLDGADLTDVARLVSQALGRAVIVTAVDGTEHANAGPSGDVELLREAAQLDPDGRLDRATIAAGGTWYGLVIAATNPADGDVERYLLNLGARAAAHVFAMRAAVQAAYATYEAEFLQDLLEGRAGSPQRIVDHGASLGWDLDRRLVLAVVRPVGAGADGAGQRRDRLREAWTRRARQHDDRAVVVSLGNDVVVLLACTGERASDCGVRALAADVRARIPDCPFGLGVGAVAESPAELPRAYSEAGRASGVATASARADDVFFDDLGVLRLLSLVPSADLDAFVRRTLGHLCSTDADARDLRQTLKVLLDVNMNVAAAARILHFHYNTLRYRIAKLEAHVGPFTDDRDLRLELALALWVFEFQSEHGGD